jgi:tetratricopeptide (TPR) repeat protein
MPVPYHEIRLQDLSPSESQFMVESLLMTGSIPSELQRFIQDKIEGNPFYIEEVINSLIESETLIRENDNWQVKRQIGDSDISSSIHGVISGRIDRLENDTKRILQEASVIGRSFLYEILKRITDLRDQIDSSLSGLERLDLIKTRTVQPDLEYIFKHALTQEVVYNGLLKKERRAIHEQIGLVIELLFQDRLPEFYETLAYHYKYGLTVSKAINYLMKSGEKCLKRYAVQESHEHYKEAYSLIIEKKSKTEEDRELLFDLLIKWSLVYYYSGDFNKLTALLRRHEDEADNIKDKEKQGMFYGWLGFILHFMMDLKDAYRYLKKALKIGEKANNRRVIGYACCWLTYVCAVTDKYEEGYSYWKRAVEIAETIKNDHYLYFKSKGGLPHLNSFNGQKKQSYEIGETLIQYGEKHSNIRSQVVGNICIGYSLIADGDLIKAISYFQKAVDLAEDPFYTQWPRLFVGMCHILNDQIEIGEYPLTKVDSYNKQSGCELFSAAIQSLIGIIKIKNGEMSQGLKMIEKVYNLNKEKNWGWGITLSEYVLGKLYFQIAYGEKPKMSIVLNNVGFLTKHVPFASKKSETYYQKAIEHGKKFDAKYFLGQSHIELGQLYLNKKRIEQARDCFMKAVALFERIDAKTNLKKAREAIGSLQ